MKTGIELIAEERQRQIEVEGYSQQHDSQHNASEFVYAAISYAESAKVGISCMEIGNTNENEIMRRKVEMGRDYPFGWDFKPSTDVRDLVKAGALIAAAIDRILAELAESEDEKIKNRLIKLIKMSNEVGGFALHKWEADEMLTWLEKQGEKKASCTTIVETGDGGINALVTRELPTDGEQNPTDKVEPKFKVRDWLIFNERHNSVYQVERIDNYRYCLRHYLGGTMSVHFDNELIRLWTLQDAKSGDVLCDYHEAYDNPLIFILKKFERVNFGLVRPSDYSSYCFLTAGDRQMFKEGTYHHEHNIKPATKEQREILLKAMADAGYTFDFENKKLKKTEPKSKENNGNIGGISSNSEWSEEDSQYVKDTLALIGFGLSTHTIGQVQEWLHSLQDRVQPQPKQEWSEEDKDFMYDTLSNLTELKDRYGEGYGNVGKCIDWLKSLKGREKPQPKQEWSKDDERERKRVVGLLEGWLSTFKETCYAEDCKCGIDWLKSLRPQPQWKPSDEQMQALLSKEEGWPPRQKVLESLYNDLKKLKEKV